MPTHLPIVSHATLRSKELALVRKTKKPLMLRSAPGTGKTQAIKEFCEEQGIGYLDSRALHFDPTDVKGFPFLDAKKGTFHWLPPAEFPLEGNKELPEEGIWVLEELPSAAPAVQAAFFQIIQERRCGTKNLKPGWAIVATGNRLQDRGVVNKLSSPLVNRLRHIELHVTAEEWAKYALDRGLMPEMAAFFRFKPDFLCEFDPKKWEQDTPFCSPRSAENLAVTLAAYEGKPDLDLITGWIGEGVGTEFFAFLDLFNSLPSWEVMKANPSRFDLSGLLRKPGHLYALSSLLSRKAEKATAGVIFEILERPDFPKENAMHVVHDVFQGKKAGEISQTPEFSKWATRNNELLTQIRQAA